MRYLNKDWWIPALLILNIIVFTGLFFYDLNKKISFGLREVIGTVTFKKNSVHRKFFSHVVWQDIESNSPVANRDTIRSFGNADVNIDLKNGINILMDEDSMVYLDVTDKEQKINFQGGSVSIDSTNGKAKNLSVFSGNYKISISEPSHIKLEKSVDSALNLFVKEGSVSIDVDGKTQIIKKDEKLDISSQGISVETVPFKLLSPQNQKQYTTSSTISPTFEWEKKVNVSESFIEVSKTLKFSKLIYKKTTTENSEKVSLGEGVYYWRVGGSVSGKTEYSEIRKLFVFSNLVPKTFSPANKAAFSYFASPPVINFFWSKNDYSNRYTLQISTSPDFKNPLEYKVNSNHITLSNLIEGTYYWRVITDISLENVNQLVSTTYTFSVNQKGTIAPPIPLNPFSNEYVVLKRGNQNKILLTWKASHEQKVFKVEVSKGGNFMNPVINKKVSSLSIWLTEIAEEGTWYWRVLGYTLDGVESGYSNMAKFHTTYDPNLAFQKAKDIPTIDNEKTEENTTKVAEENQKTTNEIKKIQKDETKKIGNTNVHARLEAPAKLYPVSPNNKVNPTNGKPIQFKWKKVPQAADYELNLYKDKSKGGNLIFKDRTKKNHYEFKKFDKLDKGKFEWEVNAIDKYNKPGKKVRGMFQIDIPNDPLDELKPDDIEITSPKVMYRE
ncbi:MAG: FecR domain-containing protein [Leptospiraceae bacterium]|nr:FecR domain-containing protein [Leptospiraceae bacterium]